MSVAAPKSQAKEPIQLDIILVCRKAGAGARLRLAPAGQALEAARKKRGRLQAAGFKLSRNDHKVILFGQLLTTLRTVHDVDECARLVERELLNLDMEEAPLFRNL
jgi:putative DNA methylase